MNWYEPKGKAYPGLPTLLPNQTHQADLVGACYLTGPIRFYRLNSIDTAINRCAIEPMPSQAAQSIWDAVYAVWKRMGIPDNFQVDNEMAFFGSPVHPRGMGPLIRLCLLYGVDLWFIPPAETWRNEGSKSLMSASSLYSSVGAMIRTPPTPNICAYFIRSHGFPRL